MNNLRATLALSIAECDPFSGHMESECEKFGMMWGCKIDCPSFLKGKCTAPKSDILELVNELEKEDIYSIQDIEKLRTHYINMEEK